MSKKIIRITESELNKIIQKKIQEQLVKSRPDEYNVEKNANWQKIKSNLIPLGFRLRKFENQPIQIGNLFSKVYDKVATVEELYFNKNNSELSINWPGTLIDLGSMSSKSCLIELKIYSKKDLTNEITKLVKSGPGFSNELPDAKMSPNSGLYSIPVNVEPDSIIILIKKLISMINSANF